MRANSHAVSLSRTRLLPAPRFLWAVFWVQRPWRLHRACHPSGTKKRMCSSWVRASAAWSQPSKPVSLGAQVMVLEKMDVIGGTSLNHGGQFIAYGPTSYQKAQKVELGPEDTKENFYKLLAFGREDVLNLDLVKLVTEHCNEAVEWALSIGHLFAAIGATNALPFMTSRHWTHNSKDGGYGYAQALKKNLDAKGTKVLMSIARWTSSPMPMMKSSARR